MLVYQMSAGSCHTFTYILFIYYTVAIMYTGKLFS